MAVANHTKVDITSLTCTAAGTFGGPITLCIFKCFTKVQWYTDLKIAYPSYAEATQASGNIISSSGRQIHTSATEIQAHQANHQRYG